MRLFVLCLVVGLIAVSCGGSDPQFTRESVETNMSAVIRAQLPTNTTIDQLECVQDGDETHWRCVTTALRGSQRYSVTVQITCDEDSGKCLSEPVTIAPRP